MGKQRTWVPCRVCGVEHTNPRSSSICPVCGAEEAARRSAEYEREEERSWDELSWEERYDRDPRRAFLTLVEEKENTYV